MARAAAVTESGPIGSAASRCQPRGRYRVLWRQPGSGLPPANPLKSCLSRSSKRKPLDSFLGNDQQVETVSGVGTGSASGQTMASTNYSASFADFDLVTSQLPFRRR